MRERIDALLFDFDGTLVDTIELILDSFRYATREVLGAALPAEELMRHVGKPLIKQMRDFTDDEEIAQELLRVYRVYNHARHDDLAREYPGVEETLAQLKSRGMPMGIVTSKGRIMTDKGMERFGIGRYIDTVVTADDVDIHKPDPYPVRYAAELLGVDPLRCAYVGDSPHDMTAAIGAGAVSIAALWGAFPRAAVLKPGPEFAIEHMADLIELLDDGADRFRADRFGPHADGNPENLHGVEVRKRREP